ncbi:hypothetical protein HRI_003243000 [Hibiscus trionum]|uniref:Uncharacterized protein n=1 Tax=Hibiscus trionum TaxID=183268 RepID=A0A9W7IIH2_HIBTR|nr:hypothetical protein HRI_003243000 [Hibiscus trionum]
MATQCVNYIFHYKNGPFQHLKSRTRHCRPRILVVSSCQNDEHMERSAAKEEHKEKGQLPFSGVFPGVQKFGRGLKENMSPKRKGDWKDLMLMSLSFAVYVYMSQMLVCAYCSWMSMPKPSW